MAYSKGKGRGKASRFAGEVGTEAEIVGTVVRVFSSNERWMAGILQTADGDVSFAGNCAAKEHEEVRLRGVWEEREPYGVQLAVRELVLEMPTDPEAIARFLERCTEFEGIGPVRARAIVEAAGADFESALEDPAALAAHAGVPVEVVAQLAAKWAESRSYNVAASHLAKYGVSPARSAKLVEKYGPSVVRTIEEDPYWLIGKVAGIGFRTVDSIALVTGVAKNEPGRIGAALTYVVKESERAGHTWFERNDVENITKALLAFDDFAHWPLVTQMLDWLINEGIMDSLPLSGGRSAIFRRRVFDQDELALRIARDAGAERNLNETWANEAYAKSIQPSLYPAQAHACAVAWGSRFSVITGGAGVGKTFIIQAIHQGAKEQRKSVGLCATTGKAAKRMAEAVGAKATTVHRLLDCQPAVGADGGMAFTFGFNANNKLPLDFLIVDEVSMLNAELAYDLLSAVDFSRTQVVLVGDHNQLPPVGAGALLRDLVKHKPCPVVELNQIVRQAGPLKVAVSEILSGNVHPEIRVPGPNGDLAGPWTLRVNCGSPHEVEEEVERVFHELAALRVEDRFADGGSRAIDPARDVLYLTPQKSSAAGVTPLNALIQRLACEREGRPVPEKKFANQRYAIGKGDRVLWTRNDSGLNLMNGTIGEVVEVLDKKEPYEVPVALGEKLPAYVKEKGYEVLYQRDPATGEVVPRAWIYVADSKSMAVLWQEPGGDVLKVIPADKFNRMDLGYAMTVHKAQGSESPVAVCICSENHDFSLSRNLLYTGVSRARKACYIVGSMKAAQDAARKTRDERRRTLFSIACGTYEDLIGAAAPQFKLENDSWTD